MVPLVASYARPDEDVWAYVIHNPSNFPNAFTIIVGKSDCLAFPLNPKSWPTPSTGVSTTLAGISFTAASISAIVPKGSLVPWTNSAGMRSFGKCWVRNWSGLPGACSGYESRSRPSATAGSSAQSIVACRPPYDCPPRKIRPDTRLRTAAHAFFSPCRSLSAFPGLGGPNGRACRNGRSQRSTVAPVSAKASANATSNAILQFPPAPCVRTRASPVDFVGRCRNPRTYGSTEVSVKTSAGITIFRPWESIEAHAFKRLVDFDCFDLVGEFRPATQHFGIFQRLAPCLLRLPILDQHILSRFRIAVEVIPAVTAFGEGRHEHAN